MQAITDERTLWTDGMTGLRKMGFTVYPKEHVAYFGRIYTKAMLDVNAEVTHDRKTGVWKIEFCYGYGKGDFKVRMTKKIERIGLKTLMDDWLDAWREFSEKYSAQIQIIKNIFFKIED